MKNSTTHAGELALLDPASVGTSKWSTRHEQAFNNKEFESLKQQISAAGGNLQPIKVRSVHPVNALPQSYEIVFGHRRHRACRELGLPVLAMVQELDDTQLFAEMDRENRDRADLTVYEQGEAYRRALDGKLYPSMGQMAESLGVAKGGVSNAVAIAKLHPQVLDAFESRLDIQRRWSKPLTDALKNDANAVLSVANVVMAERASGRRVKSLDVFNRLISRGPEPGRGQSTSNRKVESKGKLVCEFRKSNGSYLLAFAENAISDEQSERIEAFIREFLNVEVGEDEADDDDGIMFADVADLKRLESSESNDDGVTHADVQADLKRMESEPIDDGVTLADVQAASGMRMAH